MNMNIINTTSLVTQYSIDGSKTFGYWSPSNPFTKLPISFSILLNRIHNIASKYNINVNLKTFKINESGILAAIRWYLYLILSCYRAILSRFWCKVLWNRWTTVYLSLIVTSTTWCCK